MSSYATTCNVKNYNDAIKCIKKDSYKQYGEGELKHSVGVTRLKKGKEAFRILTGVESKATYVGIVEVHYDEDQILYYEIDRGQNVKPKLIKDYNIVDVTFHVPALENTEENLEDILSLYIPLTGSMKDFHLY